ncbi:MAG: hypothetical protein KDA96_03990 [Planctomycetaceae bacterium]|nr:hypothetical protein [Planctomycetaceae bacterium]
MILAGIVPGDPDWLLPSAIIGLVGILLAIWLNRRRLTSMAFATLLRIGGWTVLALCLVNPMWTSARPKNGANVLAVVADASRSHLVQAAAQTTRADQITALLDAGARTEPTGWLTRAEQDFELRRYLVSDRLTQVDHFGQVPFEGVASCLVTSLGQLRQRYEGQPLAGIILITDGNATDTEQPLSELAGLAPVFPVIPGETGDAPDLQISSVAVTQTAFDDAPVSLQVQGKVTNASGSNIRWTLCDPDGGEIQTVVQEASENTSVRFQHRPVGAGTVFYQVKASLLDSDGREVTNEATMVNNTRLVAVDRGIHPRRILYVSGRPNWEFKFLRRAVETDPQLEMIGLLRIARKEAKFDFRGREGERSNSLFRGFDPNEQQIVEEYDEPVMVRIGTRDDDELRGGFPEDAEELFRYDAIILDDIESDFFLADQLQLIYEFVSRRGGGLLMMGGQESFRQGEYDRTPVGELLPIDLSRSIPSPGGPTRMTLTRDGWLQPWVRLRNNEPDEEQRIASMPGFVTLNPVDGAKPGAVVMASVDDGQGNSWPALVVHRFGKGRAGALCIGDFWRWRLHEGREKLREAAMQTGPSTDQAPRIVAPGEKPDEDLSDHARASRQMMRWLVADVPRRLNVMVRPDASLGVGSVRLLAHVMGSDFEPREDADVRFVVTGPNGKSLEVSGKPTDDTPGAFEAVVAAADAGAWQVATTAVLPTDPDAPEEEPLKATTGWASQPDQDEMKSTVVNRSFLDQIAELSGGRVVEADELDDFISDFPTEKVAVVEIHSWQIWHQWWVYLTAVICFAGDWTLRRRRGLP